MSQKPRKDTVYVKQKDDFSCGPIAIINSLRALGFKVSYRKALNIINKDNKNYKEGTSLDKMHSYVKKYLSPFAEIKYLTKFSSINKELNRGNIVILRFVYEIEDNVLTGHLCTLIGNPIRLLNYIRDIDSAVYRPSKNTFKNIKRHFAFGGYIIKPKDFIDNRKLI